MLEKRDYSLAPDSVRKSGIVLRVKILILPDANLVKLDQVSFAVDQARMLKSSGYDVAILNLSFSFLKIPKSHKYEPVSRVNGVEIFSKYQRVPIPVRFLLGRRILYTFLKIKLLKEYDRLESIFGRPDILHAHNTISSGILARYISQKYRIPFVITEHSTDSLVHLSHLAKRNSYLEAIGSADKVFCVSNALKKRIDTILYPINTSVLGNVIPRECANVVRKVDKSSMNFSIVGVGFLNRRKDFETLIRAFAKSQASVDSTLNIVGDGEERDNLELLVRNLGITDRVVFHGELTRVATYEVMRDADLFCSTSRIETFGVAILEAIVIGLPIISTDSFGPRDFLLESELIPVGDVEELSRRIDKMLSDRYSLVEADERRAIVVQKYSERSISLALTDEYLTIIQNHCKTKKND
jgi:glycosyltransferase involved in cell wall biosynthesis